jgi:non-ribosomal peptide synthase protein (TIGR01720 family)
MRRRHLLEVNASVADGRLQMGWSFSREVHRRESIEALVSEYEAALVEVVEHCTEEGAGGHTPSDFPLAKLNEQKLGKILSRMRK